ncbi:MAG: hypothetical protein AAF806_22005 [Bacteroidota bacterium]
MLRWIIKKTESENNRTIFQYILYAIAEIVLVLVGILLAVRIDALVNERREDKIRCIYLEELLAVMDEDITDVEGNIAAFEEWNPVIREVAQALVNSELNQLDSLPEKLGTIGNYINFIQGSSTKIDELKYSSTDLILNRVLKTKILKYQNVDIAFLRDRERRYDQVGEDLRRYYNKNFVGFNYMRAVPNDLEKLEQDKEYLTQVIQRYYWNQSLKEQYEMILETQKEIRTMLLAEQEEKCGLQ